MWKIRSARAARRSTSIVRPAVSEFVRGVLVVTTVLGASLLEVPSLWAGGNPDKTSHAGLPSAPNGGVKFRGGFRDTPAPVGAYFSTAPGRTVVYWHAELETPTYLFEPGGFELDAPAEGDRVDRAIAGVRAFVDTHSELLGVTARELDAWSARPLGAGLVVSAHQSHGGLLVRGSHFGGYVDEDFRVASFRMRLVRDLPEFDPPTVDETDLERIVREDGHSSWIRTHRQLAFPNSVRRPEPVWAVTVFDEGVEREFLYSAVSGDLVFERETALHWGGVEVSGSVRAFGVDPEAMHATSLDGVRGGGRRAVFFPVEGERVVVRGLDAAGNSTEVESTTGSDGRFSVELGAPLGGVDDPGVRGDLAAFGWRARFARRVRRNPATRRTGRRFRRRPQRGSNGARRVSCHGAHPRGARETYRR